VRAVAVDRGCDGDRDSLFRRVIQVGRHSTHDARS